MAANQESDNSEVPASDGATRCTPGGVQIADQIAAIGFQRVSEFGRGKEMARRALAARNWRVANGVHYFSSFEAASFLDIYVFLFSWPAMCLNRSAWIQ